MAKPKKEPTPLVANRLNSLIEEANIRLDDIADGADVSSQHLSAIANGRKPISEDLAVRICDAFEKGIPGMDKTTHKKVVVKIPDLIPSWLLGYTFYKTKAEEIRAVQRYLETNRREAPLDNAWLALLDALGFSPAIGTDENDEPVVYISNGSGKDKKISKAHFEEIQFASISYTKFLLTEPFRKEDS